MAPIESSSFSYQQILLLTHAPFTSMISAWLARLPLSPSPTGIHLIGCHKVYINRVNACHFLARSLSHGTARSILTIHELSTMGCGTIIVSTHRPPPLLPIARGVSNIPPPCVHLQIDVILTF
jgi:hypothetical protein